MRRLSRALTCALPAVLMLALTACGPAPDELRGTLPAGNPELLIPLGSRWTVTGIDDSPLPSPNGIVLAREPGVLTGTTGCNRLNAALAVQGAAMKVGPVASTRAACLGAAAGHETALLAALPRINGVAQDASGQTVLTRDGIPSIRLVAIDPSR